MFKLSIMLIGVERNPMSVRCSSDLDTLGGGNVGRYNILQKSLKITFKMSLPMNRVLQSRLCKYA